MGNIEAELAGLAASAATTIVNLLATDAWEQVREKIGALWRRYRPEQADAIEAALDGERLEIVNANASIALAITRDWESRLLRLAAADAAVADEFNRIVADLQKIPAAQSTQHAVRQQAKASDHSTVIQVGGGISIGERPSFCPHGNPISSQCQICRTPMCWECDVIEWQNQYGQYITVPSKGFGYMLKTGFGSLYSIADDRIVKKEMNPDRVIGPLLHIDDIMPRLKSLVGDDLRHVCCGCVVGALPAATEAIASGVVCERPGCGAMTGSRCRCCHGAFCCDHVAPTVLADQMRLSPLFSPKEVITIGWGKGGHYMVRADSFTYCGLRPSGLCEMCALERTSEAEKAIAVICDTHPGISPAEPSDIDRGWASRFTYQIRTRKMRAAFLQQAENNRARTVADRCGAAINDKVAALEKLPGECRRGQFFTSFRGAPPGIVSLADFEKARTEVRSVRWNDCMAGRGLGGFVYIARSYSSQVDHA